MVGISSVWDVVPDDGDLYREVFQEHFGNTNLQVIAVFKTLKVDGQDKPTVASDARPVNRGRASINPELSAAACESLRILVLTVDKTIAPPKSKPALHSREASGAWVNRSEQLQSLTYAAHKDERVWLYEFALVVAVKKFGISFTSGQLMYHRRGNPLNLSVLKSIHLVDPPASSTSKAASANSILGAATTTNVLAAVWAAKPRSKAVPAKLPEGFVQPTPNTTPFHYAFATGSQRIACACCLFCVARAFAALNVDVFSKEATPPDRKRKPNAGHKPLLFGIDRSLINAWAARTAAERPSHVVPSALERVAFGGGAAGGADGTEWAVLSERDEAHLTGLLELINQTGELEVGALRERLEAEHTAHEAANVQAILGSAAAVPRVITTISGASDRLSDLSLTLDMFDGKLSSMRDDIGSIEMRNNSLETQARSLERLRTSVTELLHTLSAPKDVAALDTMQLSDDNVMAAITGVAALKRKMDSFTGNATEGTALRKEVMDMRAVAEFKGQLQAVSVGFLSRASKHLCSVVRNMDLFSHKPRLVPGGDAALKDVRHECTNSVSSSLAKLMSTCCADTERRIASSNDTSDKTASYKPMAQLLQDILPPITHALLFAADALAMRDPAARTRPSSGPELARRPSIVEVSLSQRGSRKPNITLEQLLQPRAPLDSHSLALLAQVTAGSVREPLRRLVRSSGSKSYVPLVPVFAVIAGWRKHLSQFPAATPLNAELKEVLLEVTGQLERHQEVLVAAAEKQEQPRGTFTNDGKGVKALGVLPQTEALAASTHDLATLLKAGIPAQRWWLPWGEEEEIARSEALARKAVEPIGRIVPSVYHAVLANLSKLAAGDAKHGPRLLLENLAALQPPVEALAALVPDVKAPAADLHGNLSRSRDKVVEEQLQASKLWPLLSFAGRLHVLLREVAPTEVQFQQGFAHASIVSTVETGYSGIDKKIAAISQRVKKHLSANAHLLKLVWAAVEESLRETLKQLDEDLTTCYDGVQVTMTWLGVEALIKQNTP